MLDTELEALEQPDGWAEVFDAPTLAALRLADAVAADSHDLGDGLVADLREHFSELELAELVLVAGHANLNNRSGNAAKQLLGPS